MLLLSNIDSVFWASGGILFAAALLLLRWALFADRARGRRRCPRCWYDMAGVPGLTCPECGETARTERRLSKTRRKRGWTGLAILLLAAGIATAGWPLYRHDGWVGLVPSTILIWVAPADPNGDLVGNPWPTPGSPPRRNPGPLVNQWTPGLGARSKTAAERLTQEAWTRLKDGRMAAWQSRVFLNRCFERAGSQGPWTIRFLEAWPVGEPVLAQVHQNSSIPALVGTELELSIGHAEPKRWGRIPRSERGASVIPGTPRLGSRNHLHMRLFLNDREIYRRTEPLPCDIVATRSDVMKPIASAEADALVRSVVDLDLEQVVGLLNVVVHNRGDEEGWDRINFAVVIRAEVLVDGVEVATSVGREELLWPVRATRFVMPMDWVRGGAERLRSARRVAIRLRGTAEDAAAQYFRWPFGWPDTDCWVGEVQVTRESPPR